MYILVFGPPGGGKGTCARYISERLEIQIVATGDMLRSEIERGTELGDKVAKFVMAGSLVPDDIMIEVVAGILDSDKAADGVVFDGFPRTLAQAEMLDKLLVQKKRSLDLILELVISDEIIIDRLSSRRICPECGAIYNLKSLPPKDDGKCDICGTEVIQREDDKPGTIRHRLEVYKKQTEPLLKYFQDSAAKYFKVETGGTVEESIMALKIQLDRIESESDSA